MKTFFKIESGKIVDAILYSDDVDPASVAGIDAATLPDGIGVGWHLVSGQWTPPAPAAPVVVEIIYPPLTARQLRLGLLRIGIKPADVSAAIAALPEDQRDAAEIEWDYASEYRRDHALIATLGAYFGLSESEIDAAWREAMTL